ncbi:MAG: hypothetical protein GXY77_07620 [Fibrobacter sp.]|nr:hypothetical protein [Fibrobacter sp.]
MSKLAIFIFVCSISSAIFGQNEKAYESDQKSNLGIFDPSHFSMQQGLSFGMASHSGFSNVKSQSLYTAMMQYRFNAPVTLNLNFGLPIHSTFSSAHNISANNLHSMDYFKSVPFDVSLTWQPTDRMLFHFGVSKYTSSPYFFADPYYDPFNSLMRRDYLRKRSTEE